MTSGYIYVLTNDDQTGIVKIGKTTKNPHDRAAEITSASGVIGKWEVFCFEASEDIDRSEDLIHRFLKKERLQKNREFFKIHRDNARLAVKNCVAMIANISTATDSFVDAGDHIASKSKTAEPVDVVWKEIHSPTTNPEFMHQPETTKTTQSKTISETANDTPVVNFHNKSVNIKCGRCNTQFKQTVARGEINVRCPNCFLTINVGRWW